MYKGIGFLYIVCFALYIVYSREPDYFDGEITTATIHYRYSKNYTYPIPYATFIHDTTVYNIDARYVLRNLKEGKKIKVIYNTNQPNKAVVYSFWGYWLTWQELLGSLVLLIALFQVAVAVTKNPTPESLLEQLENKPGKQKKYTD